MQLARRKIASAHVVRTNRRHQFAHVLRFRAAEIERQVKRKQTDYKRVYTHTWEMEFEIMLRNHKDSPITVEVNEPIGGDWEMLNSTYKYTKTSAWAAQFQVPVAASGTSVLRGRVAR